MDLLELDDSGAPGRHGDHGRDHGGERAGRGQDGRDGGDGRPGAAGAPGGRIVVELEQAGGDEQALVGVTALVGTRRLQATRAIGRQGDLVLDVRGGDGGHGGDGGGGESGGKGHDGSDATRFSSGSSGGPGGDGGDAGEPADGGRGGDGGEVQVHCDVRETHLLMLVRAELAGGCGGHGGRPVRGGEGGPGGDGGSSYSWTETESYRDGDGQTRTRTTHHSNSGGSDGRRGRDGADSRRKADDGQDGETGPFAIVVRHDDGSHSNHASRYDLLLEDCRLEAVTAVGTFPPGIFEPEQEVAVLDLLLANAGGMPMPLHQDARIACRPARWLLPHADCVALRGLPGAADPNAEGSWRCRATDRQLRFLVPSREAEAPGERFTVEEVCAPEAWMEVVRRPFTRFACERPFTVTEALAISRPVAWTSLRAGERTRYHSRLHNHSLRGFGSAGETGRVIECELIAGDGDLPVEALELHDHQGRALVLQDGHRFRIATLASEAEAHLAFTVALRGGEHLPFTGRSIDLRLHVGRINAPQDLRLAQIQRRTIKVAQGYRRSGARLLLIANHATTRDEVEAWQVLGRELELGCDILDLSYYGALDFTEAGDPGDRHDEGMTFFQQWEDCCLVLLDNRFDGPLGEATGSDFLIHDQLLTACAAWGTALYAPGDNAGLVFERVLIPGVDDPERCFRHGSCQAFLRDLQRCLDGNRDDTDTWHSIRISQARWFSRPGRKDLRRIAEDLQHRLERRHPERRYHVAWHWDLAEEPRQGWRKRYRLGELQVRRSLDRWSGSALSLRVEDAHIHEVDFVNGTRNRAALIQALPWNVKLDLFISLVLADFATDLPASRAGLAEAYRLALLADLADEQRVARRHRLSLRQWRPQHVFGRDPALVPPRFAELCATPTLGSLPSQTRRGQLLADLIADCRSLIRWQTRWFDHLLPGLANTAMTRACLHALRGLELRAFAREQRIFHVEGDPLAPAAQNAERAAGRIAAVMATHDRMITRLRGEPRGAAIAHFQGEDRRRGELRSSNDALRLPRDRVTTAGLMAERIAASRAQRRRIEELRAACFARRDEFLEAADGQVDDPRGISRSDR